MRNRQRNIKIKKNKENNGFKINFLVHIQQKYNTQTYKIKMKNNAKFERIGNTEETYPITKEMSNRKHNIEF